MLLDPPSWDLILDANGNIAVASNPYSLAQDAASQIRLFYGELWYQDDIGVPYWAEILGHLPPISVVKNEFNKAALLVPEVVAAQTFLNALDNRKLTGQVQILDDDGSIVAASNF